MGLVVEPESQETKSRAHYSTSWPAGWAESDPTPSTGAFGLSVNQWTFVVSLSVFVFIVLALITGVLIGRTLRGTRAVQVSAATSAGSQEVAAAQAVRLPDVGRVEPRPMSAGDTSGLAALLDHGPASGDEAPGFRLQALDGSSLSLGDLQGRLVLLNFWATWCTWCRYELPSLQAVYDKYKDQGVVVVGVDVEEPPPLVEAYVQRYGLSFPMILDLEGKTAEAYRVRGLPMTFFIDGDGRILRVQRGAMREDELELYVRDALADSG